MSHSNPSHKAAAALMAVTLAIAPSLVIAQDGDPLASPLQNGGYAAAMASYVHADQQLADQGIGGVLALGYRQQHWALELSGIYTRLSQKNDSDPELAGATLGALVFPFEGLPNFYAAAALGGVEINRYKGSDAFNLGTLEFGLGHLFALGGERYEWAIRTELRYRVDRREADITDLPDASVDAPRHFDDWLINIGLQLPFGHKAPAAPPPPAAEVVAPLQICADGQDNDGDGSVDYPADPGCQSPDDVDESDA